MQLDRLASPGRPTKTKKTKKIKKTQWKIKKFGITTSRKPSNNAVGVLTAPVKTVRGTQVGQLGAIGPAGGTGLEGWPAQADPPKSRKPRKSRKHKGKLRNVIP